MWNKAKIMRIVERAMKRTAPYLEKRADSTDPEDNFQLGHVLTRSKGTVPEDIVAYAYCLDEILLLHPLIAKAQSIGDWAFNYDSDLFSYLEQGYDLAGMSLESHCGAWSDIEAFYDNGDIEHMKGMQVYLRYCKRKGITVELLRKELDYEGMDVMAFKSPDKEKSSQGQER